MNATLTIRGGQVVTPQRTFCPGTLVVEGKQIQAVAAGDLSAERGEVIDAAGCYVVPGFVDIHLHGGRGSDAMDATPEALEAVARYHVRGGTTSFLATTASAPTEEIVAALESVRQTMARGTGGAEIVGVHVEGPYFSTKWYGCHLESAIRVPERVEVDTLLSYADIIRHMTLAPELPGALDLIARLKVNGITASAGHSAATYEEVMKAVEAGLSHTTHMYCAMSTTVKEGPFRIPGLVETVLLRDELTTELIADGFHVPPPLMQVVVKAKGTDRVALTTDAMRGAGMPDGLYAFGPQHGTKAIVRDGIAVMPDNTGFASSTVRMDVLVRNAVRLIGLSLQDAVKMATLVPARIIGVADRKGSLEAGKDADIVLLTKDLQVASVIVGGREMIP